MDYPKSITTRLLNSLRELVNELNAPVFTSDPRMQIPLPVELVENSSPSAFRR